MKNRARTMDKWMPKAARRVQRELTVFDVRELQIREMNGRFVYSAAPEQSLASSVARRPSVTIASESNRAILTAQTPNACHLY